MYGAAASSLRFVLVLKDPVQRAQSWLAHAADNNWDGVKTRFTGGGPQGRDLDFTRRAAAAALSAAAAAPLRRGNPRRCRAGGCR